MSQFPWGSLHIRPLHLRCRSVIGLSVGLLGPGAGEGLVVCYGGANIATSSLSFSVYGFSLDMMTVFFILLTPVGTEGVIGVRLFVDFEGIYFSSFDSFYEP